jgi:hypothetical protein
MPDSNGRSAGFSKSKIKLTVQRVKFLVDAGRMGVRFNDTVL